MKKVTFTKLKITNFKGIESFEVDFSNDTIIKGDNGTGKSTLYDAINWCLFGKNSHNDSDFGIKNTVRTELNRADHIVELSLLVDEAQITAKCIYHEKWTKRQGTDQTVFTGHETLYFWNNVPCSQKEYKIKVSEVIEEQLFKLLTNPLYFNVNLKEVDRRDTLIKMAGPIPDEKIINGTPMLVELFEKIKGQKTIDEYRKEIAYEKSGLKKSLAEIGPRIDEILRNMPKQQNWQDLENEVAEKVKAIKDIDEEISGLSATLENSNKEAIRIHNEILAANREMQRIEMKLKGDAENEANRANIGINNARFELSQVSGNIKRLESSKESLKEDIERFDKYRSDLRAEWQTENAKTLSVDAKKFICPVFIKSCPLPEADSKKEEAEASFNTHKNELLDSIQKRGIHYKEQSEEKEKQIIEIEGKIIELKAKEAELLVTSSQPLQQPEPIDLESSVEYKNWKKISEQTVPAVKTVDTSDLNEMKQALQDGINELNKLLATRTTINQNNARIEELKADEKRMSKDLASLEKSDFAIESFQKKKMEVVEQSVNDKFKLVKFKLFRTLVNGGEEPCCVTTMNNVEFGDLNHAGQLQAGIDIKNALSGFYGVSAPCIIDNAESCTSFPETDSQLIRLYVTLDKELTIA
jgi:DNA repair exonuclease SbcCD ATPase subunit